MNRCRPMSHSSRTTPAHAAFPSTTTTAQRATEFSKLAEVTDYFFLLTTMNNHDSFDSIQHAQEELQRLAREELGRSLTNQELHAMADQLMHGMPPTQAFDSFIQSHS
jgi:hypothetical protein